MSELLKYIEEMAKEKNLRIGQILCEPTRRKADLYYMGDKELLREVKKYWEKYRHVEL